MLKRKVGQKGRGSLFFLIDINVFLVITRVFKIYFFLQ